MTWNQQYIFPDGSVASRSPYATTLRLWPERFLQRRNRLARLGFDEVFERMWELYLAYSEAAPLSGYLGVHHWTSERWGPR